MDFRNLRVMHGARHSSEWPGFVFAGRVRVGGAFADNR